MLIIFTSIFYSVEKSTNNLRMIFEKFEKDNNETWDNPDFGRNVSKILPHSTPFINEQFESLDNPSAMDRGKGIHIKTEEKS